MENDSDNGNSLFHAVQSVFLSLLIGTLFLFVFIILGNYNISITFLINPITISILFCYSIAAFIFSLLFYFLKKKVPGALYLILFFYSLWAVLFILSKTAEKKSLNQIPDIMDEADDAISFFLIGLLFFLVICNFTIVFKNWLSDKKHTITSH